MLQNNINERYEAIDGLRTIGTIGILMMHVRGNSHYEITSYWYNTIIASFTNFVFLFMIISGFAMCCGYFEKIIDNRISIEVFYKKRFTRIWPCFALLVLIDLIISPSKESLYEGFADLTLCFGLLPNANISVIGVGWFLGVIFLFYMLFPFFCFLIGNKKRAWFSFAVALIFNFLCSVYFFDANHIGTEFNGRVNIIFCAVYFLAGGLIYLYRDKLSQWSDKYRWIVLIMIIISIAMYLGVGASTITQLVMYSLMLIYSLGKKRTVLHNSFTHFIGNISMEIFLCHMVIYRVLEKIHVLYIIKYDVVAYFVTVCLVLAGAIIFAYCTKNISKKLSEYLGVFLKRNNGGK